MSRRLINPAEGERVLADFCRAADAVLASPDELALAVRFGLQLLRQRAPGNSVEVRVPPYGAVQVIEGPKHTRGTPPAVIEILPKLWLELVCGLRRFDEALSAGEIQASGVRADLQGFLPLWPLG